jgi:CubicO group peptidase (beta-lactamase class C family)
MTPKIPLHVLGFLVALTPMASSADPSSRAISDRSRLAAVAMFEDPERRAKLAAAFPAVDRLMQDFVTRENVPGAAWGIVVDGELLHIGTDGLRDVEGRAPVRGDTVFRIASMTKSFTAMAILRLRDQGKLSLDDPAERHVPELRGLRYPTVDAPRITLRHLLTQSAGFPEDNPWGDQQLGISEEGFSRLMREGIPFSNPPGVAYEYSNYGFAILGRVIANVSGLPYTAYIEREILRPLGMASTTLEPGAVPSARLAQGYRWEDARWKREPQLPDGAFGAMGGMLTSLEDLGRYVGLLLAAWPPRDGADTGPVSRASLREMQQMWRLRPATIARDAAGATQLNVSGYGYGLRISQTCDYSHVVAHSGGLPGFGSQMRWLPEYGVGLIAFGNRTYTPWGDAFGPALAALKASGGLMPRAVQPSEALIHVRNEVTGLVNGWDDAAVERLAAVNLFLDRAQDRRRTEFAQLRTEVGVCRDAGGWVSIENPLRGDWLLRCERGDLVASVTLAPIVPPKVQHLELRRAPAGGPVAVSTCP